MEPVSAYDTNFERGLNRLATAVLLQALRDLTQGSRSQQEDAWMWINGQAQGPFTFQFCCDLLRREPQDVRQKLLKAEAFSEILSARLMEPFDASAGFARSLFAMTVQQRERQ